MVHRLGAPHSPEVDSQPRQPPSTSRPPHLPNLVHVAMAQMRQTLMHASRVSVCSGRAARHELHNATGLSNVVLAKCKYGITRAAGLCTCIPRRHLLVETSQPTAPVHAQVDVLQNAKVSHSPHGLSRVTPPTARCKESYACDTLPTREDPPLSHGAYIAIRKLTVVCTTLHTGSEEERNIPSLA